MSDDLNEYRKVINKLDNEMIDIIKQRMKVSIKIGKYKKDNNIKVLNTGREEEVIDNIIKYNNVDKDLCLEEEFIKELWTSLMNYSKKIQN
jgi:chorismate mutase